MDAVIVAAGAGKPGKAKAAQPIVLPAAALSEDGTTPEQGDPVSFTIDGTVQSSDGQTVTILPEKVNGEDIAEEATETPKDEVSEQDVEKAAQQSDDEQGGMGN